MLNSGVPSTPLPFKTPTRTIDLMMITPKANHSEESMSVLQPINLTFTTPMVRNGNIHSRTENNELNEDKEIEYEETYSPNDLDKIEKIIEVFSSEYGDIVPWLKSMKMALTKDQIQTLLDGEFDKEDINKVLEISVKRGCLEKILQEGECYYRLCAMV